MPTKSNMCFGLVVSEVGKPVSGKRGWRYWYYVVRIYLSGLCLGVEGETTTSNDWNSCNFKTFRGHTFMTAAKESPILWPPMSCAPPPPSSKIKNISLFKNKRIYRHVNFMWQNVTNFYHTKKKLPSVLSE